MKTILAIALCAGLVLSASAQSEHLKKISSQFSGYEHPTMVDINGDLTYASSGEFQVRGVLGRSVVHSTTEFTAYMPYGAPGCDVRSELVSQDYIEMFEDGSMMFFKATSGSVCVDLATGKATGELAGIVTGGTERFEGVTGSWSMEFTPIPLGTGMTAFTGAVEGTIELP